MLTCERAKPWITQLGSIAREPIAAIIDAIPSEWEVTLTQRQALLDLLLRRRDHLCDTWLPAMAPACGWQQSMLEPADEET